MLAVSIRSLERQLLDLCPAIVVEWVRIATYWFTVSSFPDTNSSTKYKPTLSLRGSGCLKILFPNGEKNVQFLKQMSLDSGRGPWKQYLQSSWEPEILVCGEYCKLPPWIWGRGGSSSTQCHMHCEPSTQTSLSSFKVCGLWGACVCAHFVCLSVCVCVHAYVCK